MPSCAYDIGARRCPLVAAVLAVGTLTALAAAGADNNATAQASQAISAHADEFQQVPGFIVLAMGFFENLDDLRARWSVDRTWKPNMDAARRERMYGFWKKAVTRSFDWLDSE